MPCITLPDGNRKEFSHPVTVLQVAESIGPRLAKDAIAAKINGQWVDTSFQIEQDAALEIVTQKNASALEVVRHSTAHLLAHAVKTLYPSAQVTIGPVIEDGFYYDFAYERAFTPEDLEKIEAKMHELAKKDYPVERIVLSREEAIKLFSEMGEHYKVKIIQDIPGDEVLTAYREGDFVDLCRGPHVPRIGLLNHFKLTKLSGAYWRGDSKNEMLQRIYGTAWLDAQSLKDYLDRLEEAKKRDHREIGKKMDLFHFQAEAPGMVFWHPNGWTLIHLLRKYLSEIQKNAGYEEVNTPQILDASLWQQSGHWEKFSDDIFALTADEREYAVKPMSCPCHVQIFKQGIKSYRDLPIRMCEFGIVHRSEPSGTLHGLMRVRALVQDDGHVFCTPAQIKEEVASFVHQLHQVYKDFGFTDIMHRLSTRPSNRIGSDEIWDQAEQALSDGLNASGVEWGFNPGEGAFYGPKIEFSLRDCLGRVWQCGTIQVDFFMAGRLGACYIDENGEKQVPVMLHRAILGSLERFTGILLEHYAGKLPLWLSPVQIVVMNITEKQRAAVEEVTQRLKKCGFRVQSDLRNEKINFKIREHTIARVPYQIIIGDKEIAENTLSVRSLSGGDSVSLSAEELIKQLEQEVLGKGGM
jgi:threonyl-tRNA synthetase